MTPAQQAERALETTRAVCQLAGEDVTTERLTGWIDAISEHYDVPPAAFCRNGKGRARAAFNAAFAELFGAHDAADGRAERDRIWSLLDTLLPPRFADGAWAVGFDGGEYKSRGELLAACGRAIG